VSGYAASARLQGGVPRFAGVNVVGAPRATYPDDGPGVPECITLSHDWIELVGRPLDQRLAAWWADMRETFSQTTFFLFDPESWRQ
jgi:hypothetical protein